MKIYQINGAGNFSGVTRDIEDDEGAPLGWVRAVPPAGQAGKDITWTGAGWALVATPEAPDPALVLAALKTTLAADIDDTVASRIAGSTRFAIGYTEREAAAVAFKAAGYVGDATEWVTRFARNTGMTDRQATDLILAQASGLRTALKELEDLRMDKYIVLSMTTQALARAKCDEILASIRAVVIP